MGNPRPTETVIALKELQKVYQPNRRRQSGEVKALAGISLEVLRGEFFGLLGPNGAGKTTTVGILTTRVLPTGGSALIDGIDVVRDSVTIKRRIGVVAQANNLDRSLTARENLLFHAEYFGVSKQERERRADELLAHFQLTERANEKTDGYSGGMAQRLKIARALMHAPSILFLDEPTAGLDPQARRTLWELLRELNQNGQTIFLTTHNMDEADQLCGRVAIMDKGKLLAVNTPAALKQEVPGGYLIELRGRAPEAVAVTLAAQMRALPGVADVTVSDDLFRLYAGHAEGLLAQAMHLASQQGVMITYAHVAEPSLENLFLHLTGRSLEQ